MDSVFLPAELLQYLTWAHDLAGSSKILQPAPKAGESIDRLKARRAVNVRTGVEAKGH
jgi:hypothetical protein